MNNSKTLFKIAAILTLIEAIFLVVSGFFVFFSIAIAIPMFFAYSALSNYSNMTVEQLRPYKSAMIGWSIFLLIVATLPGILALIGYIQIEKQLDAPYTVHSSNETVSANEQTNSSEEEDILQKIQRLVSLKERNIINEEEYKTLKEKIINGQKE